MTLTSSVINITEQTQGNVEFVCFVIEYNEMKYTSLLQLIIGKYQSNRENNLACYMKEHRITTQTPNPV